MGYVNHIGITVGRVRIEVEKLDNRLLASILKEMNNFIVDHDKTHAQDCYDREAVMTKYASIEPHRANS